MAAQAGAPDTIRTCDLCLRSNLSCPTQKCDGASMLRYATQIIRETGIRGRNAYSAARPDFLPTAYVVLTRETGFKSEKFDGKAH
jgi:hypothetical protein